MTSRTIMAFDFGTKSIGSAIGQEVTGTASPLKAFKANDGIPHWEEIEKQIKEWQPHLLVVGLPTDLHGKALETITPRAKKFAQRLHGRFGLPVEMHDERLSTREARADLFAMGGYKALSKGNVDCQSAVVILESWFEAQWGA
ncbi:MULTISPECIES: Holliday junction resolvase RuvX [Vibrio]|uniref:Putative pre-16S rRNA nuclease n=1 Tax=Vibrio anguillarum TaxID=55601 RepID=A0A289G8V1_VIBAN|nr:MULTISPECIES: Holliday junction resolvase RuvX [Vibrio]OXX69172.1 Holliday junction resolvase RuvX [Vibrio sp. V03_P4A6T147]ASW80010.1 Holliday junction resolvase RuvX [Vibrio anguillarum]AXN04783.1 Holliday junction resolvase RuvX [Vibrio anguillarum]AZS25277.1 Holliday junction resolvase RuvX [Vibrio anguillarum]MBF4309871.1 Holliday junction resolvase RuvX [Vibrio anguillarum]